MTSLVCRIFYTLYDCPNSGVHLYLVEIITDGNGSYSWTQDLSQLHLVFIQPRKSTKFIADSATGGDCTKIGTWDSATKTCTLTTDVYETIQIDSNYITLDGNGHAVIGAGTGYGIYLCGFCWDSYPRERTGISIKNIRVKNFFYGIHLWHSSNNTLIGNTASNNRYGIYVAANSNNNLLADNTASGNITYGITLGTAANNTLIRNTMSDNAYNFFLAPHGLTDEYFNNYIDTTNLVDGRPIYYVKNAVNQIYDATTNAGTFYCINCNNVLIKGLTLTKNGNGIFFWKTLNSRIENVVASNNLYGISLYYSSDNYIADNTTSGSSYGINLWLFSINNTFLNNTLTNNSVGVGLHYYSNNNTLSNSIVSNISNTHAGVSILFSSNNQIYNNTFINNRVPGHVYGGSGNIFNLDVPTGGNYWSNFDTPSEGCYDANNDGFCDAPFYFYGGVDYLPWAKQRGWEVPADTTSPTTTTILSGTSGNNGWYVSNVQLTLTAVDNAAGSGVKEIYYRIDGGAETVVSGSSASATINTEGMHTLTYYAIDKVGNIEQARTAAINVDKTPPAVIITGISGGATYQLGMVPTPGYTVTDNLSGVASSSAGNTNDNGTCRITHTYTVAASDIAGNAATEIATYYVTSTSTGVTTLINQMLASGLITNDGIANSLIQQAGNNNWNAFINHVNAQTGKFIDPSAAELLIQAANIAMQC